GGRASTWPGTRAAAGTGPRAGNRRHEGGRLRRPRPVRESRPRGGGVRHPILGVTMGDPAGVGPEIIARAAADPAVRCDSRPVVIGAASAMSAALALVAAPLTLHAVKRVADCRWADGTLEVLDLANVAMQTLP